MSEKTWRERVDLAEHYIATGQIKHHIFDRKITDLPWEYVTAIGPGGSHRLDIQTEIEITAQHPCGLVFTWWVPLERRDADGYSTYKIDLDSILGLLERLNPEVRSSLRQYLRSVSEAVLRHTAEQQEHLDRQRRAGDALYQLSAAAVGEAQS